MVSAAARASGAGVVAAIALSLGVYGTPARLSGPLLYDDKAAVMRNPVVTGAVPLLDGAWSRDFWGERELRDAQSHKSWRPLVTLSYRANYVVHGLEPYGYHVVNVALHAAVSALVVPATRAAFGWPSNLDCGGGHVAGLAAALFAVHPVHVEATQNIVGRAELMMSLFYLLGFVAYTHLVAARREASAVLLALLLALSAMLCKETGFTLPVLCGVWDTFLYSRVRARALVHAALYYAIAPPLLRSGVVAPPDAPPIERSTVRRLVALAVGAGCLCAWRLSRNGGSSPTFNAHENPAALHPQPLFRALSVMWVWAEYCWVVWWPATLSCDWSYPALPPIMTLADPRLAVLAPFVLMCLGAFGWACLLPTPRPRAIVCGAFGLLPFALASNLITVVGTAKAERLLYLPSLGACMMAALLVGKFAGGGGSGGGGAASPRAPWLRRVLACAAAIAAVGSLSRQCSWYADVWCDGARLWAHAVAVQDGRPAWLRGGATTHALAEYGMQLSWAGRNAEAVAVLERQIAMCEAELDSKTWPTAGRVSVAGFAPLSIVYRILGDMQRSIAVADRGLAIIQRHRGTDRGAGSGALSSADLQMASREAARCLAARALAVFTHEPEKGIAQMKSALALVANSDSVVLALAQQLNDYLAKHGLSI